MCVEHNGWKNYETWALVAHSDNDESLTEQLNEIINDSETIGDAIVNFRDSVRDILDESTENIPPMFQDILRAGVDLIDYRQIVRGQILANKDNPQLLEQLITD